MCEKIRKISFIMAYIIMITNLLGCSKENWIPSGKLLLPMAEQNNTVGIYSVDLSNSEDVVKVFDDKQYIEIKYPSISDRGMLCVGYSEPGVYSVLNVKGEEAEKLYQGNYKIFYPQYYDENSIIFIMKDETDNTYLYSYDFANNSLSKIYNGAVDIQSRPVLSNDGAIYNDTEKQDRQNSENKLEY